VQSARTLDRAAGGLGLGLTLVRSLVAMHGGTVSAESAGEGHGSAFIVRLPLASPRVMSPAAPVRRHLDVPEAAKVLIVEDNTDSRDLLCELLEQAGFECRATDSGRSALSIVDEFRPDVAILDVGLPEMDGFELARRIRASERHRSMCLIALTGYGQASDRASAREAGFDEHLVKPVQGEQLLALVAELRHSSAVARHRGGTPSAA
jgi:two-component system CheB/CheR fusion protein